VCEVNLLTTFQKLLRAPSSLVMSQNTNEQRSVVLPYIGAESAVCSSSSSQCDLKRTLAVEGVFEGKRIPVEGGRCIGCQCICNYEETELTPRPNNN
jgi:hypothetical protein